MAAENTSKQEVLVDLKLLCTPGVTPMEAIVIPVVYGQWFVACLSSDISDSAD